jgi:subtilisin family serine protease
VFSFGFAPLNEKPLAQEPERFENGQAQTEVKRYSNATLEDSFADDAILIVLSKETTKASFSRGAYNARDFSEIRGSRVTDLTELTGELVERQFEADRTGNRNAIRHLEERAMLVETDKFRRILRIELAERGKENVLNAIRQLERRDDILYAGPDYVLTIGAMPDPEPALYFEQKPIFDHIGLPQAWEITTGASWVSVGVIDTGIDAEHIDLTDRVCRTLSRDFLNNPATIPNPSDVIHGHGTGVAGIIGANRNSNMGAPGVIGVCWNVSLVSLRAFDAGGNGLSSNTMRAIDFAAAEGIDILNLSAGWNPYMVLSGLAYDAALETSISNYPGLFVGIAHNDNKDIDLSPSFPGSYNLDNLITVGATTYNRSTGIETRAVHPDWGWNRVNSGSNTGERSVDIFAPGTRISTTGINNRYVWWSGTSMAAPFVAGVAALMKSVRPMYGSIMLRNQILANSDMIEIVAPSPTGSGWVNQTVRRLNAHKALFSLIGFTAPFSQNTLVSIMSNYQGALTIPSYLNGIRLTRIEQSAFHNQTGLTDITIQENITWIGQNAFAGCTGLRSMTIPFVGNSYSGAGHQHFGHLFGASNAANQSSFIPPLLRTVTVTGSSDIFISIGANAFLNCSGLTDIVLPERLDSIGNNAFQGCTGLTNVVLPGVMSIGLGAFQGCNNLRNITIPFVGNTGSGTVNRHFGFIFGATSHTNQNSFIPASLRTVTVKAGNIASNAFNGCSGLTNIVLEFVTSVGSGAFTGTTALTNIAVNAGNQHLATQDGILYNRAKTQLIHVPHALNGAVRIPNGVTTIPASAFSGRTGLTNVVLPASITSIGANAFQNCTALNSITISSNVTTIGANAFAGCGNLTIYAERNSRPSGWDTNWNSLNRPVFWRATLSADKTYVVRITKTSSSIENHTLNGTNAPFRYGFPIFPNNMLIWNSSSNFTGNWYSMNTIINAGNQVLGIGGNYHIRWS